MNKFKVEDIVVIRKEKNKRDYTVISIAFDFEAFGEGLTLIQIQDVKTGYTTFESPHNLEHKCIYESPLKKSLDE